MKKCEREVLIDQIENRICSRMIGYWQHVLFKLEDLIRAEKNEQQKMEFDWDEEFWQGYDPEEYKEREDRIQSYYDEFDKIAPNGDL